MEHSDLRFATRDELFAQRPGRLDHVRLAGAWVAGSLAGLNRPTVAIVGCRAPTDAGRARAERLARALAQARVCVISGLALGIDGAAHAGALAGGGATVGVLGGGHDHFFPRRNGALAAAMIAGGGAVVSPFPPGEPARPPQFLQRNAVVAALSDVVVVVEAAERSGALNTAGWATGLGIDVLAFPGDVDAPKSAGTNALIRDGATLVRDAADVLAALGIAAVPAAASVAAALAGADGVLFAALGDGPLALDALLARTGLAPAEALAALVRLELARRIERHGDSLAYARAR